MIYGVIYLVTLGLFFACDMAWLGRMVSRLYRPTLGDILLSGVNMVPAIAFYLLYPVGLMLFVIVPALKSGSIINALIYGALFGFFTYATYDLTNQVSLRNWTLQLTVIDVAWGTALAAVAAMAGFWVGSKIGGGGLSLL